MSDSPQEEVRVLRASFWSARDPEGRAFAPLADAYLRTGDVERAQLLLQDGLLRHPDFATGHLVAARVARARGNLVTAREHLDRVLELDGGNTFALVERAAAAVAEADREGALEDLRRAVELAPGNTEAVERLAALEDAGEPLEATGRATADPPQQPPWSGTEEDLREAEVPASDGSIFTRTMGDLYARQGFRERAVEIYEHLVAAEPGNDELLARLNELRASSRAGESSREGSPRPAATIEPAEPEEDPAPGVDDFTRWLRSLPS